ncbi:MAG: MFS transporter [Clostridia bacterium]|jgi:MFS transporter|nr:MFS transporter [Clostridia bacterium]
MKLNYKKVIFVGFAFFLILAFWQAYDAIVPLMLVNKFGLNQTVSGVIMALDNVLAVFMLPLFGSLSDRTKSKYGKRTPYIVLGTIVAICAFIGLSFMDNLQLNNLNAKLNGTHYQEMLWEENMEVSNGEYNSFTNQGVVKNYSLHDYAAQINFNKNYDELTDTEKEAAKSWYLSVDYDTTYYYNKDASAPYSSTEREGDRAVNAFSNLVTPARNQLAFEQTKENPVPLIFFIILLLVTLVAMATFRSPAVALMPDVTIKPLRSQANAVINLLGTAGGIFVLVLGMVFGTSKASNQMMSFTWYIVAVCAIMALGLALFILKVREPKWAKEMEEDTQKYCPEPELQEAEGTAKQKLDKSHLTSLLLILASVALWYIGYNAVTSKYSLYASNVLQKDYNLTLLIAQGAAIIAYIPVGFLAGKIGRKKTILIGVAMLTAAFGGAIFVNATTSDLLINLLFALAGIAWATINVNSFPMVVELASGGDVGKYTGYYYTASMAAQILTPILSGALMDLAGNMRPLFPYATVFVALAFVTMLFVRHGDSKPIKKPALEAFDVEE